MGSFLPPGVTLGGGGVGPTPTTFPTGGGSSGSGGGFGDIFKNPQNLLLLGTSILSSLLNRPKGLSKEQKAAQDAQLRVIQQLMSTLQGRINTPLSIDPREQSLLRGQIAETTAGAQARGRSSLAGRGLSQSGILGDFLNKVNLEAQRGQNAADLFLLGKSQDQRNRDVQQLLSLVGIQQTPTQGQSAGGAVLGGIAPILAYLIRTQQLEKSAGGSSGSSGNPLLNLLPLLSGGG